ncbi:MAG TPA: hypothetical protein VMU59_04250 [Caulobacteraceae bacterium]|nr:hypothetical protein [Caulobacteraceae bacterium]
MGKHPFTRNILAGAALAAMFAGCASAASVQIDPAHNQVSCSNCSVTSTPTAPATSTTAESSHAWNVTGLNDLTVTTGALSGYLMVFDALTPPADGAVTPKYCITAPAGSTVVLDGGAAPVGFTTGIDAVFSTTGCFTKTASSTAIFSARGLTGAATVAPAASSAAEASHAFSYHSVLDLTLTTGATPGYLMVFDAASAPADGVVAPAYCVVAPASSTVSLGAGASPVSFVTGLVGVFSSTGCLYKTASATAFFTARGN